jgi:hypothetical protein
MVTVAEVEDAEEGRRGGRHAGMSIDGSAEKLSGMVHSRVK